MEALKRSTQKGALEVSLVLFAAITVCGEASFAAPSATSPAAAASAPAEEQPAAPEAWAVHGQITNVTQGHPTFTAPYSGPNSLRPDGRTEETTDATLYVGVRVWKGAELWLTPEVDQGRGLDNTVGVAGFPSGEAYKVGSNTPYLRLPRAFIRQTIELGGDIRQVLPAATQLAGTGTADALTITMGKFGVTDIFDTNTYAHDPRGDFLNWSTIDTGTFDYAADAWGFTYGVAAEWSQGSRTLRGGAFQLSREPNGKITGVDFSQFMLVAEFEQRYEGVGPGGKVKLLGFLNRGRMARYRDAVELAAAQGGTPDVAAVRKYASRPGLAVNIEHALTTEVGAFVRAGVNDGTKEAYEFTEINRTLSAGVSIQGTRWGRADDTLGIAGVANGLSGDARAYFAAGGTGILIGDGRLNYGAEKIVELFYSIHLNEHVAFALDYQHVNNPAYNRDRGPVSIYAIRAHAEF
jgi:high affinity Mn2+ porin